MILGVVVIGFLVSIPAAAHFLQKYMNKALGPILAAVGLLLPAWLHKTMRVEKTARKTTGIFFVLAGLTYLCMHVIF